MTDNVAISLTANYANRFSELEADIRGNATLPDAYPKTRASQTGWTGLIARSLDLFARLDAEIALQPPKIVMAQMTRDQVAGKVIT